MKYVKTAEDYISYQYDTFDEFLKGEWDKLVEAAEERTGEQYDGLEPLLTKDGIIDEALEMWNEEIANYEDHDSDYKDQAINSLR